jgi:hypothetical protein
MADSVDKHRDKQGDMNPDKTIPRPTGDSCLCYESLHTCQTPELNNGDNSISRNPENNPHNLQPRFPLKNLFKRNLRTNNRWISITAYKNLCGDNCVDKIQSTLSTGQQTPTSFLYIYYLYEGSGLNCISR